MAEFQKVIAEWKRLCKSRLHLGCSGCPVNNGVYCRIGNKPFDDDFEYEILKWAAANPEPRYPTWREYLCSLYYGKIPPYVGNIEIPADIAKKLRVGPIREDKP